MEACSSDMSEPRPFQHVVCHTLPYTRLFVAPRCSTAFRLQLNCLQRGLEQRNLNLYGFRSLPGLLLMGPQRPHFGGRAFVCHLCGRQCVGQGRPDAFTCRACRSCRACSLSDTCGVSYRWVRAASMHMWPHAGAFLCWVGKPGLFGCCVAVA